MRELEMKKSEKLPPGFRFHPTDEELITYYLKNKISDSTFTGIAITDVDLNRCEPWDLPGKAKMGEKEWYFFNLRDRKYPTGLRTNRATNAGYWKTTGKDKEIFDNSSSSSTTSELVGMKKTLVFYKGRAPRGEKTNWVIHEYRNQLKSTFKNSKDEWVVCRVFQKSSGGKKYPSKSTNPTFNMIYNHAADGRHMLTSSSSTVTPYYGHDPSSYYNNNNGNGNSRVSSSMITSMMMNLNQAHHQQRQQQAGFSFSGPSYFNLGSTTVVPRPILVQPQFTTTGVAPPPEPVIMTSTGYADVGLMHCGIHDATGSDQVLGSNTIDQTMEPCPQFEGYWPNY